MKDKILGRLGVAVFAIIFLGIIFFITSFVSGSILAFLGLKYVSFKSLMAFLVVYFGLTIPFDLICDAFIEVINENMNVTKQSLLFLEGIVNVGSNIIVISLADLFIEGVRVEFASIVVASTIIFILVKMVGYKLEAVNKRLDEAHLAKELENQKKAQEERDENLDFFEKQDEKVLREIEEKKENLFK